MTETMDYLKDIVERTSKLYAKFKQRSKTKKMKAAVGTASLLRIRAEDTIKRYEENAELTSIVPLQIQKYIFEDILVYWEKELKKLR